MNTEDLKNAAEVMGEPIAIDSDPVVVKMIKLPKVIYIDRFGVVFAESEDDDDIKYIRSDIVKQMVEDYREYTAVT